MAKQGRSFIPAAASLLASLACIIAYSSVAEAQDKWWADTSNWMDWDAIIQAPPCGDHPAFVAHFNDECDLVLAKGNDVYWSSNSSANPQRNGNKCYLVMQEDGNLVIYNIFDINHVVTLWASNSAQSNHHVLYYAQIQTDGNLVIYPPGDSEPIWASNTVLQ